MAQVHAVGARRARYAHQGREAARERPGPLPAPPRAQRACARQARERQRASARRVARQDADLPGAGASEARARGRGYRRGGDRRGVHDREREAPRKRGGAYARNAERCDGDRSGLLSDRWPLDGRTDTRIHNQTYGRVLVGKSAKAASPLREEGWNGSVYCPTNSEPSLSARVPQWAARARVPHRLVLALLLRERFVAGAQVVDRGRAVHARGQLPDPRAGDAAGQGDAHVRVPARERHDADDAAVLPARRRRDARRRHRHDAHGRGGVRRGRDARGPSRARLRGLVPGAGHRREHDLPKHGIVQRCTGGLHQVQRRKNHLRGGVHWPRQLWHTHVQRLRGDGGLRRHVPVRARVVLQLPRLVPPGRARLHQLFHWREP